MNLNSTNADNISAGLRLKKNCHAAVRRRARKQALSSHELWCLLRVLVKSELENSTPSRRHRRLLKRALDDLS